VSKIFSLENPPEFNGKVVQCHGVFDLLHVGHVDALKLAKTLGDTLVVSVTADYYVNKGPGRPIIHDIHRAEMLAALACVDYVCINNWSSAIPALKAIRPDIYVKHKEYALTQCDEFIFAQEIGAEIKFLDTIKFSTTGIIERCKRV